MSTYKLTIATPDGNQFQGEAEALFVRGAEGDLAVLAKHTPFITSVKPGKCRVHLPDGEEKVATLDGGLLTVGIVRLVHLSSARNRNGVEVIAFGMNDDGLSQIHYDDARKAEDVVERMLLTASATQGENPMKAGGYGVTLFRDVRRMALHPKDDLIDLTLKGNYKCRVYVRPEDFVFVREYIRQRIR